MNRIGHLLIAAVIALATGTALGDGRYVQVEYPPSTNPDELQLGVTYTLWIPEGAGRLRGLIVHQHGCGAPACQGGATAAYDLHWQALAQKWDCALLGPSYQQGEKQDCRLWSDPRQGSAKAFLRGLRELGQKSGHPELEQVPWCLWGHSGGAHWVNRMQMLHPDRVVASWLRSGSATLWSTSEGEAKDPLPKAVYAVPMMCNPGVKEKGHKQFGRIWNSTLATFQAYRAAGAPIGLAPDPRTVHECGDSRYLAILFFDACLAMRLPEKSTDSTALRPVDLKATWLANPLASEAVPAAAYRGNPAEAVWLPNEALARAWMEYVKTGAVSDSTPPPAPQSVKVLPQADGAVEITWDAAADLESGLAAFIIQRDGQNIAQVPEKPLGKFGRPLFQTMSYHDTPEQPLPAMRYLDRQAKAGAKHEYRVIAVNSVGLKSAPSTARAEVSIIKGDDVDKMVDEALAQIGSVKDILKDGQTVVIKPNLVSPGKADRAGVTTDVRVVAALVRHIQRQAKCKIILAEGAAAGYEPPKRPSLEPFLQNGYGELVEKYGVELRDLNADKRVKVKGILGFDDYEMPRTIMSCDVLICVPVMKSHELTGVSLGMKNLFGLLPLPKMRFHAKINEVLCDLVSMRRPDLTVVDGLMGTEGQGPVNGRPVKMDLILAGRDIVAVDAVTTAVMGYEPWRIRHLAMAGEHNLGEMNLKKIAIKGQAIESVRRPFDPARWEAQIIFPKDEAMAGRILALADRVEEISTLGKIALFPAAQLSPDTNQYPHRKSYGFSVRIREKDGRIEFIALYETVFEENAQSAVEEMYRWIQQNLGVTAKGMFAGPKPALPR